MEFFEKSEQGMRMQTQIQGLFILKVVVSNKKGLVLELNPVNDKGKPIRHRGLIIRDTHELTRFISLACDKQLYGAMKFGYGPMLTNDKVVSTMRSLLFQMEKNGLILPRKAGSSPKSILHSLLKIFI
jgi:hypothetical protein